ncbi:FkbM family methyltransferase [Synechococcus sp. B60.1]|uniref:FkbM family methyltransferase n=1 Tax=unclassified Synechococcus TaxID=2626047 RepID=UPI0039C112BA
MAVPLSESGSTWNARGISQARAAETAPTAKERRNAWSVSLYYWNQGISTEPNHLPCLLNRLHALWVLGVSFTFLEEALKLLNQLELNPERWKDIPPPNIEGYELAWKVDSPDFEPLDPDLPSIDQYLYYLARWIAERIGLPYQTQVIPFWRIAASIHPKDLRAKATLGLGLSKNLQIEGIRHLRQIQAMTATQTAKRWAQACYQTSVSFLQRKMGESNSINLRSKREFVDICYEGYTMRLEDSLDSLVTHCCLAQGRWFESEIDFVRSYLKPGMMFIDVGANVGLYTLVAAQAVGTKGKVIAFEPTQSCVEILKHNVSVNRLSQVTINPYAVGSESGQTYFLETDDSVYNRVVTNLSGVAHPVKIIRQITLDDWWRSYRKPLVDMVKIDVVVDPLGVIQGGRELIKSCLPLIQLEAKDGGGFVSRETSSYLSDLGYTFFAYNSTLNELSRAREQARSLSAINLIAVPEARYASLIEDGVLQKDLSPSKKLDSSLLSLLKDLLEESQ